jgi:adenosyl cobinamide kinase/adenosyl cobinamide phosphate guanylyltransferase
VIVLVLGGARSGKSEVAEAIAASRPQPVTYFATAVVADDPDFAARIEAHRRRRPPAWVTVECGRDLARALTATPGTALVDSLGSWLAAHPVLAADAPGLAQAVRARVGDTVLVSDEVGLSVHPSSHAGRRFRDALGDLNGAIATVADRVLLVVAGRTTELDRFRPDTFRG